MIKSKVVTEHVMRGSGKKKKSVPVKIHGWQLNEKFSYIVPLQSFLINMSPVGNEEVVRRLSGVGRIKLLVVSGVFIQEWESRVDLLIVGDHLKKAPLENVIKILESEIGKELKYAAFSTDDFQYRLGMCDKLVRDILDYPHEKIVDKLGVR